MSKKEPVNDKGKVKEAKDNLAKAVIEAKKKILQGALTQAQQQLMKFITQERQTLGGDDSVLLLPGLVTVAQIHIIEGRNKKAEEFLNTALWNFLKSKDKADADKRKQKGQYLSQDEQLEYRINLARNFAKLHEAKNNYKEAIKQLKNSIYLESTKWGPEHPCVAQSYFLLGKVFVDMSNPTAGEALFSKVAEIWYRYLKKFFDLGPERQQQFLVEQFVLEQAINYLAFIQKHFQEAYEDQQAAIVFTPASRTYYSIGLLYRIFGDDPNCEAYLKEVYRRCLQFLPPDHRKTAQMRSMLQSMNIDINVQSEPLGRPPRPQDQLGQMGQDDD